MLKNYFKTALRSLWRDKASTMINLAGLTAGITSSLVLFLLVSHHNQYDAYHSKNPRIYRVVTDSDGNNERNYTPGVPAAFPDAFRNDFPEAEEVTFISHRPEGLISVSHAGAEPIKFQEEKGVAYVQSNFFKVFDRKILAGDATAGLDQPNQVILSQRIAKKYFGREDAVGELVNYDQRDFRVTAVMEDFPSITDFPFDVLFSYATIKTDWEKEGWDGIWSDDQCYFVLRDKVSIAAVNNRLPAFHKKYHKENRHHQAFVTQPLREVHFDTRYNNFNYNTVSRSMLLALNVIGVFLLITASVNFINLTTAEAIKRSREVGIRKALGSSRSQLIRQFLGETTLVTVVAMLAALVGTQFCLTLLNPFLGMSLSLNLLHNPSLWIFVVSTAVGVSLLSGLYPSLVISGFEVTRALKNQLSVRNTSGFSLRRGLVVLQFMISQTFIIGTIILIQQMNFLHEEELGFRKDAIIILPLPEPETTTDVQRLSKFKALREEVLRLAGVEKASLSSSPPSSGSTSNTTFEVEGDAQAYRTQVKMIDSRFVELFGLPLAAGSNVLDLDTAQGFLVNERFAAMVGFTPQEMVGRKLKLWERNLPVVGVVKDFHTVSLREPIVPTALFNDAHAYRILSLQLSPGSWKPTIQLVQSKWESAFPNSVFRYEFLDDTIRKFYEEEDRLSVLLTVFTSMAIFIGCLGLFGLATFMANQKTKEIGVRKVLGASVESIVALFSREYIRLIMLGFLVAAPLSAYIMNLWLNEFAYKITIGPFVFVMGIGITMLIAMGTVGYRSFQAATVNPAQSLKSE